MGHMYPWATLEKVMYGMTADEVCLYLEQCPKEMLSGVIETDPDRPDPDALKKLQLGKVVKSASE
jgi:hypothetical protein